jgi:hypothetical protein
MRRALAFLAIAVVGCSQPRPPAPFPIVVRVVGSTDEALEKVPVRVGTTRAPTDGDGAARFSLLGEEGARLELGVECPTGAAPPASLPKITLARTSRPPEYLVPCRTLERGVLVAIHTVGVGGIRVLYLDREIARTDEEGYALARLQPKIGETVTLTFDTSDPRQKTLRPANPEQSIAITEAGGVYTVEQTFVNEKPKVAPAAKPRIAVRVE